MGDKETIERINERADAGARVAPFEIFKRQTRDSERPLIAERRTKSERIAEAQRLLASPLELEAMYDEMQSRAKLGDRFPVPKEFFREMKGLAKELRDA